MTNEIKYTGPSGLTIMFLIFMTLKLTNFIDWSWWAVTAPLWVPITIVLTILFIVLFIYGIGMIVDKIKN